MPRVRFAVEDDSPFAPAPRRGRRLLRRLIPFLGAIVLGVAAGVGVAAVIRMPQVELLAELTPRLITRLYDHEGKAFTSFARERRVMIEEGAVPLVLQHAVIAAEDSEFFRHGGIDALGIVRSVVVNLRRGKHAQGASTITMQLVRELTGAREKTWRRKVSEALMAVEIEKRLAKEQILTAYCNLVFLGHGNYGMEAAALYYFGRPAHELTLTQAATLAGIIQRPSQYSPYRNPKAVQARRNYVLDRMVADGYITRAQHRAALAEPLAVQRHQVRADVGPYFAEEVRQYLEGRYGAQKLYEDGLQVYTTLDPAMQRAAENALRDGLLRLDHRKGWRGPLRRGQPIVGEAANVAEWEERNPVPESWMPGLVLAIEGDLVRVRLPAEEAMLVRKGVAWTGKGRPADFLRPGDVAWFRWETPEGSETPYLLLEQEPILEGASLIIESGSGAVRAMVGGWDFQRNKFNRVTQAQRQVGSAFKPFVYGAALERGYSPSDTLFDAPAVFTGADGLKSYSPRNYYRKYYGIITLRRALEHSVNVTAVKLLDLIGANQVVDFAHRLGLKTQLPPYPSLALGSADLIPIEVASAYAAIANQGIYLAPYFVDRVQARDGRVLEEHQTKATKVLDAPPAYVLTHMLEGVVDRGTAASCADLPLDLAGKTGTTNDYTDAWFIGFTPRYTILSWVGYDQKRTIGKRMTGAEAALPIWRGIVERGLADGWLHADERFSRPAGVICEPIEYWTGLLPTEGADKILDECFLPGTLPEGRWAPRWQRILDLPWPQQRAFYKPRERESMPEQVTDWSTIEQGWSAQEGD